MRKGSVGYGRQGTEPLDARKTSAERHTGQVTRSAART